MRNSIKLCILSIFLVLVGCATYQHRIAEVRSSMRSSPTKAIALLKDKANEEGKDQLVYLLDYGSALQVAGHYKASNDILLRADKMADIKDYISISKQAASLVFNEAQVQYKGDDFENIMINTQLAINFLMLGENESALVETRRINEKIDLFRREQEKSYPKSSFAVYLSAMIWEANKEWDDAYIAYERAYKLDPQNPFLPGDLIRSSRRAQRWQAYKKWKKQFAGEKALAPKRGEGEVVLIFQQGWGPRKYPSPEWYRIPRLYPVGSRTQFAQLELGEQSFKTQKVYDVEKVAIDTLQGQYAKLVAKRIAGIAVKKEVQRKVQKENEALGAILGVFMHLSDVADLRQWSTLPQSIQVARVVLPAGKHKAKLVGVDFAGEATGEEKEVEIEIKAGQTQFVNWRSLK